MSLNYTADLTAISVERLDSMNDCDTTLCCNTALFNCETLKQNKHMELNVPEPVRWECALRLVLNYHKEKMAYRRMSESRCGYRD